MSKGLRHRAVLLSAAVLGFTALAAVSISANGATVADRAPSANGRIVFQADVRGATQIFTIKPNGRGLKQVTDLRTDDPGPGAENAVWSPDGSRIAFDTATRYEAPLFTRVNLFTIAAGGGDLTELPLGVGNFNGDPAYSPDGTQISFDQDVGKSAPTVHGIFIADADGSDARRLTTGIATEQAYDTESQWSPDGDDRVHPHQEQQEGGDFHDPGRRHRAHPADPVQARCRESRLVTERQADRLQQLLRLARGQGGAGVHHSSRRQPPAGDHQHERRNRVLVPPVLVTGRNQDRLRAGSTEG